MNDSGIGGTNTVSLTNISPDGTSAFVTVPTAIATTTAVSIPGASDTQTLQNVPRLDSFSFTPDFSEGSILTLTGVGFVEGEVTIHFGPVSVIDPDVDADGTVVDVSNSNRQIVVTIPASAGESVTVETGGGTSNTMTMLLPNIRIDSPKGGETVNAEEIVEVTATAFDPDGIESIEFFLDGVLQPAFDGELFVTTTDGRANIFGAGKGSAPGGGLLPPGFSFEVSPGYVMRVLNVTGSVSGFASGCRFNGADGGQVCGSSTNVASSGGISGIIHGNRTMFLAGVFLDDTEPTDPAPDRLDVTNANDAAVISPLLNQTFFIGDGLASDGTPQEFSVPDDATRLFLGFIETFNFSTGGAPGAYTDNGGSLSVGLVIADSIPATLSVPEVVGATSESVTAKFFFTAPALNGDNSVTIGARASDANSTSTAEVITVEVVEAAFSIDSVASFGTPADPGLPSANAGQTRTLTASQRVFTGSTLAIFPTLNISGVAGIAWVQVTGVSADGKFATIVVPTSATTGVVEIQGVGSQTLQVVPRLTTFNGNNDFRTGQFIRLFGSGFMEGSISVDFGDASVVDPDTGTGTIDVHDSNRQLNLNSGIPADADGTVTVTTTGGTSNPMDVGPTSLTDFAAVASIGTPADGGVPSANALQTITVTGTGFRSSTNVTFPTIDTNGITGAVTVRVSTVLLGGTEATVVVPQAAVTGDVTMPGTDESFPLQIVPRLFGSFTNTDFRPGVNIRLNGRGFVEGGITVSFGDVSIVDPDVGSGTIDVFSTNSSLNVTIPSDSGEISVETEGGVSNTVTFGPTSFTGFVSVASFGTPVDTGASSANASQTIVVTGTGFRSNTNLIFPAMNDSGLPTGIASRISNINIDDTEATVVVPQAAVTGDVTMPGTDESFPLQIVPRLFGSFTNTDFRPGVNIRLNGRGFVEGGITVSFGDVSIVDPDVGSGTINVHATNSSLDVSIPGGGGSEISVETEGGVSNTVIFGPASFTGFASVASIGTPADGGVPSANALQTIVVTGTGFRSNTNLIFPAMNDSGLPTGVAAKVANVNIDGTEATVVVPQAAVTGDVTMPGTDESFRLQIVPRLFDSFTNTDFRSGVNMRLNGRGFIEGGITVNFGDVSIVDPDVGTGTINVFSTNSALNVSIPGGGGGEISVETEGGVSNTVVFGPTSFTGFAAVATIGTPADGGAPSANASQTITVTGTDFRSNTNLVFSSMNDSGIPVNVAARVSSVNLDGTEATVVVTQAAVTGDVTMPGTDGSIPLQIVPRISSFSFTSFTPGVNLRLNGRGFVEGAITVNFGSVALDDPDIGSGTINVFSANSAMNVTIPEGAQPDEVFVETEGGTSNVVALIEDTAGIPPTVAITAPIPGETVLEGGAILITASATDDVFLTEVRFSVKDPFFVEIATFTDKNPPFEFLYFVPAGSPLQLVIDATATDLADNVGESDDVIVFVEIPTVSIDSVASIGVAADAGVPSANVSQTITFTGDPGEFDGGTIVTFPTTNDSGVRGTVNVAVNGAAPDGSTATVAVPLAASTGGVTVSNIDGNFGLQIVPSINSFTNNDFRPSGTSRTLTLSGSGYIEGGITVSFDGVDVVDPSNSSSIINVFSSGNSLNSVIPAGPGPSVSVITAGGTSNSIQVGPTDFTGIETSADFGTPADGGQPSANVGQAITVTGAGFGSNTNVTFPTLGDTGIVGTTSVRVASFGDGTEAVVTVPNTAVTGNVSMPGNDGSIFLQVVPRITSFTNSDFRPSGASRNLTLIGNGFVEGGITVHFGDTDVIDPNVSSTTVDVFSVGTGVSSVIPSNPGALVSVTTTGGTSNEVEVGPTSFTELIASADFGTPTDGGERSANVGQSITLEGTNFRSNSNVAFPTIGDTGISGFSTVRVSGVNIDGTEAVVTVPNTAVTGNVTMPGNDGSIFMQVVPRITSFTNSDFRQSGTSRNLTLIGNGFVEGGITVHFGDTDVIDPDVSTGTIDVFSVGTGITSVIPSNPGALVSVTTAGGTSNEVEVGPTSFTELIASADFGTPADGGERSANVGQSITLEGTNFRSNSNVAFPTVGDTGISGFSTVRVSGVNIDGTEAVATVPNTAVTGNVTMPGNDGSIFMQVVPRITSFTNSDFRPSGASRNLTLIGNGFVEGGITVHFGDTDVIDPDVSTGTIDVFSVGTGITSVIPPNPGALVSVTTAGGTSNEVEVSATSFTELIASADFGTPADGGERSANVGQSITLEGTNFRSNSNVAFPTVGDTGISGFSTVRVSGVNIDGTEAVVTVPNTAVTGNVTMPGNDGSIFLQVVPRITSFTNSDFRPSGASRNLTLVGNGFVEGGITAHFGDTDVIDPDVSTGIIDVFSVGTGMNSVIPSNPGALVSVTTAGGTSNEVEVSATSFTELIASADFGTPTDGGERSANVGQSITLEGTNFRSNSNVTFPTVNDSGITGFSTVRVSGVNIDGTEAVVTVPNTAVTGSVTMPGNDDSFFLQVVPRITSFSFTSFSPGSNLRLNGRGFVEGDITIHFGGTDVVDPNIGSTTVDVFSSGTAMNVTIPAGAEETVSVTTLGGTSNAVEMFLPTVTITSPRDGDAFAEESTIIIKVSALDSGGIASVDFLIDGSVAFTDDTSPYQFEFTMPVFDEGGDNDITLGATVTDTDANTADADDITISVVVPSFSFDSTATEGTPVDAGESSANVGQTITFTANYRAFDSSTSISFPTVNDSGVPSETFVNNSRVSLDGTTVNAVVPNTAATGDVKLFGLPDTFFLQIVPRVTTFSNNSDFRPGVNLRLHGNGFIEGGITVHFGDVDVVDPSTSSTTINVHSSGTLMDVTMPSGAGSGVSVTTGGGTSNRVLRRA